MTDPYTPTTEEVRHRFTVRAPYGQRESSGQDFDRWLAAHDAQVREDAAKDMREAAAVAAESSTNPAGFDHGSLNEGSRSQWYAHGKRDSAAAIRALPIPSTGTEEVEPKFEIPGFEGTNELLAKLTIRTEGEN